MDIEEKYNLCFWVGRCLRVDGRIREAVKHLEEAWRWRKTHFVEDHPDRLASQHELAIAYQANGQVRDAIALLEQVVAIQAKTLAEDHPSRLASQHELASAYQANGQVRDAITLPEQVVAIRAKTLACHGARLLRRVIHCAPSAQDPQLDPRGPSQLAARIHTRDSLLSLRCARTKRLLYL